MSLQSKIDNLDYPPTHSYTLEPLEPQGSLKLRLFRMPKKFWEGESFLDVGCNKGFFSLHSKAKYIEGIDSDPRYVTLCKELGINASLSTFREYIPERKFDRILLGNVMHYMFRECEGWEFIIKLAAISSGLVLIEAPTGMDCIGMKDAIPKYLRGKFNGTNFRSMMEKYFILKDQQNSPSQGRLIMTWERKPNPIRIFDSSTAGIIKKNTESTIYESGDSVVKIQKNNSIKDEIRYFIAGQSPISNGIQSYVYNGGFQGWTEHISHLKKIPKLTRQKECLEKLAKHNVFLAKLGYTELDMSISNFFSDLTFYDKGGVFPIKTKHQLPIFLKMFKQSFDIPIDFDSIYKALESGDSLAVEKFYKQLMIPGKIEKEKFSIKNTTRNMLSGHGLGKFRRLITSNSNE